jgi:hypothetical protein
MNADGALDVLRAQREPGELIDYRAAIKPGGNRVPAFLELVSLDQPDIAEARAFFNDASTDLGRKRPPLVFSTARFSLHFNTDIGLYPRRQEEFSALATVALGLLEDPPTRSLRDDEPLTVLVRYDEGGVTFELDEASVRKLQSLKGSAWTASPVHIAHQTLDDFERVVGSFVGQMGSILTKLDEQELLRLGGVRYVDASQVDPAKWRVLGQWPSRKKR